MADSEHKKIYNKNAREKALLEEAYTTVYKESAVDVELDHWWDFDIDDVIRKVYHGARQQLPPASGTPEYEENSEKIITWLKSKYPKPNDYNIDDVKFRERTSEDATEWALRQGRDPASRFYDASQDEDAEGESAFKVGDWVYDDEGAHASIVHIDGDEIALYDGKEGWTVDVSDISHEQRDHDDKEPDKSWDEAGTQEYDMERDPLGRREADPREW